MNSINNPALFFLICQESAIEGVKIYTKIGQKYTKRRQESKNHFLVASLFLFFVPLQQNLNNNQ